MAAIFLSYSSKDKVFATRLAESMRELGHRLWLDEWVIKVGESIPAKIQAGIKEADYLVVVMSAHAVQSGWVEREWQAMYWSEASDGRVRVLPALLEDCEIPTLLRTKAYADFRTDYGVGLVKLMAAIAPALQPDAAPAPLHTNPLDGELMALIQRVHTPGIPASQLLADVLAYAHRAHAAELIELCSTELAGYRNGPDVPPYRLAPVYASTDLVNMQYIGWGGSVSNILQHMQSNPTEFVPQKLAFQIPVAEVEAQAATASSERLFVVTRRLGAIEADTKQPDTTIYLYGPGDTFGRILLGIRTEVSRRLIERLPGRAGGLPAPS